MLQLFGGWKLHSLVLINCYAWTKIHVLDNKNSAASLQVSNFLLLDKNYFYVTSNIHYIAKLFLKPERALIFYPNLRYIEAFSNTAPVLKNM